MRKQKDIGKVHNKLDDKQLIFRNNPRDQKIGVAEAKTHCNQESGFLAYYEV